MSSRLSWPKPWLTVTFSSLSGVSSEKFSETARDICKDSSSESLRNTEVLAQDMDAQFTESIVFGKTLYKYEILERNTITLKIMKQQGLLSAVDED